MYKNISKSKPTYTSNEEKIDIVLHLLNKKKLLRKVSVKTNFVVKFEAL